MVYWASTTSPHQCSDPRSQDLTSYIGSIVVLGGVHGPLGVHDIMQASQLIDAEIRDPKTLHTKSAHLSSWELSMVHCASMTSCMLTMLSFSPMMPDRTRLSSCHRHR